MKQVIVHESIADSPRLDFNAKNFKYVTESFGTVIEKMEKGGRMYLRSLSRSKPSDIPANLDDDFPFDQFEPPHVVEVSAADHAVVLGDREQLLLDLGIGGQQGGGHGRISVTGIGRASKLLLVITTSFPDEATNKMA